MITPFSMLSMTAAAVQCPDKLLANYSIYQGGIVAAQRNLSDQADCCSLCHGDMKDECVAWEWIDQRVVHSPDHNCDIYAKAGLPKQFPGRVSALSSHAPTPTPPGPPSGARPCNSDGDCESLWNTLNWRCLEDSHATPSAVNNCHMHADTYNTTCACLPSPGCGGGGASLQLAAAAADDDATTRLLVIGDSISEGMESDLSALLKTDGWSLFHNPGNGDNSNYGAHCVKTWAPISNMSHTIMPYDVISFQFGLHDIAHDEERLSVEQYIILLTEITEHLVEVQKKFGTKLLWVKTTPVPTVDAYGYQCNGTATVCLNPARFDRDVVRYNAAADAVVAKANTAGAKIATADLYSFVIANCGGVAGYATCPGFQLPMNVHYTPKGWAALAAEMHRNLLLVMYE